MHVAKLAALAVLLASSAHAQIPLFDCTLLFPLDCGFQEQAKVPGRATVVFAPTRAGSTAVRLHTEPGDRDVDGSGISERNDL